MKNVLLLSLLCLINITQAKEIPSFDHVRNTSSFGASKEDATMYTFRNHLLFNDEMPLEDIEPTIISWFKEKPTLHDYANGNNVTQDDFDDYYGKPAELGFIDPKKAEAIILKFEEEHNTYRSSKAHIFYKRLFKIRDNLGERLASYTQNQTYVDIFTTCLYLSIHYNIKDQAARCQETIRVLKNIGIKQTLPNDILELETQLVIVYSESNPTTFAEMQRGTVTKEISILKKMLAIFESIT